MLQPEPRAARREAWHPAIGPAGLVPAGPRPGGGANVPRPRKANPYHLFVVYMTALSYSAIIGVFAVVVFILGIVATKWEEDK
jgi:hypothetical protein